MRTMRETRVRNRGFRLLPGLVLLAAALAAPRSEAEPHLALSMGLKCSACHVNPTGGGMRNVFGAVWGQNSLPARANSSSEPWTGELGRHIAIGADLRGGFSWLDQPDSGSRSSFELNSLRAYVELRPIPDSLALYIDQRIAPGATTNAEAYMRIWSKGRRFHARVGQMYLPYGIRLQDDGAFIREFTGMNFNTPDRGVELGFDGARWTAQLAVTNGTAGAAELDNGKQWSVRSEYVAGGWRAGVGSSFNDLPDGLRRMHNLFGGVRTGPVVWLAEFDYIVDDSAGPRRRQWIALAEADWKFAPGQNLKLTAENLDPDRSVSEDRRTRLSLVWEYTPLPFLQLRAGIRDHDDEQEVPFFNQRSVFLQLHGYL